MKIKPIDSELILREIDKRIDEEIKENLDKKESQSNVRGSK